MRPGKRRKLDMTTPMEAPTDQIKRIKARIPAQVEHPFGVIKRQFGQAKVRYRGPAGNTERLHTLLTLANRWVVRRKMLEALAIVRPRFTKLAMQAGKSGTVASKQR